MTETIYTSNLVQLHKHEISSLQNEIQSNVAQISDLRAQHELLLNEKLKLQESFTEIESKLRESETAKIAINEAHEVTVNQLNQQIADLQASSSELLNKLHCAEVSITLLHQISADHEDLKQKMNELQMRLSEAASKSVLTSETTSPAVPSSPNKKKNSKKNKNKSSNELPSTTTSKATPLSPQVNNIIDAIDLSSNVSELNNLQEKLKSLQDFHDNHVNIWTEQVHQFEVEKKEMADTIHALTTELNACKESTEELQHQLDHDLSMHDKEKLKYEHEVSYFKSTLEILSNDKLTLQEMISSLELKNQTYVQENLQLSEDHDRVVDQLTGQIEALNAMNNELIKKIDQLHDQVKVMEEDKVNSSNEWSEKSRSHEEVLNTINHQIELLTRDKSILETSNNELMTQLSEIKKTSSKICEKCQEKDRLIDIYQAELDQHEGEVKSLLSSLDHANQEIKGLNHDKIDLKRLMDELNQEAIRYQEDISQLEDSLRTLKEEEMSRERQVEKQAQDVLRLKSQYEEDIKLLKHRFDEANSKNSELAQELKQLNETFNEKDALAMKLQQQILLNEKKFENKTIENAMVNNWCLMLSFVDLFISQCSRLYLSIDIVLLTVLSQYVCVYESNESNAYICLPIIIKYIHVIQD